MQIGQNALLGAVKAAALAVDNKASMPILANVRLTSENGVLTVTGTDLNTTVTATAF